MTGRGRADGRGRVRGRKSGGGRAEFRRRYGPWALVAGGSEGIGAELAGELAARGLDLLLVARGREGLERRARALREAYGIQTRVACADLSQPAALERVREAAEGLEVGLLVLNAAAAYTGLFLRSTPAQSLGIVDTNCRAPLELIHRFVPAMVGRGRGGVLIMSSMAGFQGAPLVSVYGASKAFLISLGEALSEELAPHGVDVLVCAAGATRTPSYLAGKLADRGRTAIEMEPAAVARVAVRALGRKPLVVAGWLNRAVRLLLGRLLPRRTAVRLLHRGTRSLYRGGER
jgi:short-subunit dehydrogenase